MSMLLLYFLLVVLPNLSFLLGVICFMCIVLFIGLTISFSETKYFNNPAFTKPCKIIFIVFIGCIVLSVFLPDSKQMLYVVGGYAATNSEEIVKLPGNIRKAANAYLENIVKENNEKKK